MTPCYWYGRVIDLDALESANITADELARTLGHMRRFSGQGGTVLWHSILVAMVDFRLATGAEWRPGMPTDGRFRAALLHDAPECWTGDIIRPVRSWCKKRSDEHPCCDASSPLGEIGAFEATAFGALLNQFSPADTWTLLDVALADSHVGAWELFQIDSRVGTDNPLIEMEARALARHCDTGLIPQGDEPALRRVFVEALRCP